jgi:hypothetical protein
MRNQVLTILPLTRLSIPPLSLIIYKRAARRRLGRLKAGRRRQGQLIHKRAARRRQGRLIHKRAARRLLGRVKAGRRRQGLQVCIFSRNYQNYLMNRSRRYSKNFFSNIFVCYLDLPNPAIFFVSEDLCYAGQLIGVAGRSLILQKHHISHLAVSVALSSLVGSVQALEDHGTPELPLYLIYKLQPSS